MGSACRSSTATWVQSDVSVSVRGPGAAPIVVAIGGGHGCSRTLGALRRLPVEPVAVVSVADDGGSSGRLRRDLDVVALGDLRMAILALSPDETPIGRLAGHRFGRGELDGHSLGNLMLLGQLELAGGDLVAALDGTLALLGGRGRVLPCATTPIDLRADTAAGSVIGQVAVATTPRIRRVAIVAPTGVEPVVPPDVIAAIEQAELVVLGPGSLYTSILPNLLMPAIARALERSVARVVLVANLREQPGETEGMDLVAHLSAMFEHVPALRIDVLLCDVAADGRPALDADVAQLSGMVGRIVTTRLGDPADGHDPELLAAALAQILEASQGSQPTSTNT